MVETFDTDVEGKTSKSFTTFRHSLRLFNSFCSFLLIPLILSIRIIAYREVSSHASIEIYGSL